MLLSLAASDLGVGLLAQPLYIALCIMDVKQIAHNDTTYNITFVSFLISGYVFAGVSFLNVVSLIADRFLAILLHLRYQELVTHKRVVGMVIFIWLFSAIFSLMRLFIPKNVFYAMLAFIGFAIFTVTTFFSVKIYLNVRRHMNQIQVLQIHQEAQNEEIGNVVRSRKFAIAAVYVYLVFLFCYLPHSCFLILDPFISGASTLLRRLQIYSLTLVYLNSSLNPLIYCWKMKQIRHTMMNILQNTFSSHY